MTGAASRDRALRLINQVPLDHVPAAEAVVLAGDVHSIEATRQRLAEIRRMVPRRIARLRQQLAEAERELERAHDMERLIIEWEKGR